MEPPRRRASDHEHVRETVARAREAIAHSRALIGDRADVLQARVMGRQAASEARFHALVDVAGHVTWVVDASGRAVAPQPAWQAFTRQSFADLRGADGFGWVTAIHPDDRDELVRAYQQAVARAVPYFEHRARIRRVDRDGGVEWRHTLVRMVPVRGADGAVREWVGANVDITELVAAAAAEHAARAEAEHARAVAEAATAAKGRVLAAASHDLRTPLTAIAGYAELLADGTYGPVTEAQHEALDRIAIAVARLQALTSDIVRAARAEARGDVPIVMADVALEPLCRTLETLIAPQVAAKGLVYACRVGCHANGDAPDVASSSAQADTAPGRDDAPVVAYADGERVLQVLVNLVGNAIKFTPPGGSVAVDARGTGAHVELRVRDTGRGIHPEHLEAVFEPFVQADADAAPEGVGLGLATSRDLARRMGGEIVVESEPGRGSVFTLTLPRGRTAAEPAHA